MAALAVVFWHWKHFFYLNDKYLFQVSQQPLYDIFYLFYNKGYLAVQLFFCISGFIFFWLYNDKIFNKEISGKDFFILRFSRLYPLHFITMWIVCIEQICTKYQIGTTFVYHYNDLQHFILQLFFISSWGFEKGYSFNGPIWSVSVEIFLYIIFFLIARQFRLGFWKTIILSAIGLFLILTQNSLHLAMGLHYYFFGGLIFILYKKIQNSFYARQLSSIISVIALICCYIVFLSLEYNWTTNIFKEFQEIFICNLLFLLTILTLTLNENKIKKFSKSFSILGNISYSIYLLHFPLQLAFINFVHKAGLEINIFYRAQTFFLFFALLFLLSLISYRFIELPIQNILRHSLIKFK